MRRPLVVLAAGLACFLAPMAAAFGLWSTSATGTMTVTTAGSPPAAPTLACGSSPANGDYTFTWPNVPSATSYTVYSSTTNSNDYTVLQAGATSPYRTTGAAGQSTTYYRAKSVNASGDSDFSNTLKITRSGSNMTCGAP